MKNRLENTLSFNPFDLLSVCFSIQMSKKMKIAHNIGFYNLFLLMIFTFMPNVIFLNLIVAILGDSYEETITSITEKCLRDEVYLLLKYEA